MSVHVGSSTGGPWLPGQSGNPSGSKVSKHFAELYETLAADFDGQLSAVEGAMLGQALRLMLRSRRCKDVDDLARLSNAATRILISLRCRRAGAPPKPRSLDEHLRDAEEASS